MTRLNSVVVETAGRVATLENALSDHKHFGLDRAQAIQIVRSMAKTVSGNYLLENTKAGVSKEKIKRIPAAYTKNVSETKSKVNPPEKRLLRLVEAQ